MSKKFKKGLYIFVIATIATMIGVLTTFGVSAKVGDVFTVRTSNGYPVQYKITSDAFQTVEVFDCPNSNSESGDMVIPETVINPDDNLEYLVTGIGDRAFYEDNYKSFSIPDSVTYIGDNAFYNCTGLTSLTISKNITEVGDYAFSWCVNLTDVTIESGLTSISYGMFYHCNSLTNIIIPETVTNIGDKAFYECRKLETINLTAINPPTIGSKTFKNCKKLKEISIPKGTKDAYVDAGWPEDKLVEQV